MKNVAQINGILRLILGAGTPLAAYLALHGINAQDLSTWIITGIPIAMGIWSWFANSQANQALTASKIRGVESVVDHTAPESVQAMARDTSEETKGVVMAPAQPKNPPPLNIRRKS